MFGIANCTWHVDWPKPSLPPLHLLTVSWSQRQASGTHFLEAGRNERQCWGLSQWLENSTGIYVLVLEMLNFLHISCTVCSQPNMPKMLVVPLLRVIATFHWSACLLKSSLNTCNLPFPFSQLLP